MRVIGDRIYSGCYMEFGYWEENPLGLLEYTSLSQQLEVEMLPDEEFWTILEIEGNLVFQSLDRIYIFDPEAESVRTIDSDTQISGVFEAGGALYFQRMDQGVFKLINGGEVLVSDHPDLRTDEVVHISGFGDQIRLLTRHRGFFSLRDGSIEKWRIPSDAILSSVSIYSATVLRDGSIMLGTISGGLIHLDAEGRLLDRIDQLRGLDNNTVLALLEDMDRNIWLALDNGVSMLDLPSAFRIYYDKEGILGSIYASASRDGYLYLGTNQGLFFKRSGSQDNFQLIEGTQGQVWSLQLFGDALFCNHHLGTFIVNGDEVRKIVGTKGSWMIKRIPSGANLLMVGSYDGLQVLEKSDGVWRLRNQIQGFENSARFVEWHKGEVFVNHEYKGVFRLELDTALRQAVQVEVDTILKGADSGIARFDEDLLYANRDGVFRYESTESGFQRDSLLSSLYTPDSYISGRMIAEPEEDRLWIFSSSEIIGVSKGSFSGTLRMERIPLTQDARNGIAGYENFRALPDAYVYLFGNRSGYMTVDIQQRVENDFELALSEVRLLNREKTNPAIGGLPLEGSGDLKPEQNSLEFFFRTTEYSVFPVPEYQYRLEGMYPQWSTWDPEPSVRFENLPSGDYTLEVRARIGEKPSQNMARYTFTISRPWYLSSGMIFLYVLALLLGGLSIHFSYRKFYKNRQKVLVEANRREMELERARNEKEIIRLKNEQLKKEFKDKSNELAASTMSIIKKNEILSRVKHRLLDATGEMPGFTSIVDIIDQSLQGSDDWEMFKEAFNNTDRDFLDKLKKVHPNLSPNDIKLCAYLRLNLSSKEIAPLFNISVRSVEIKRYRLRKKMNLHRDENLVNYILTL